MENFKALIFFVFSVLILTPGALFAYSRNTHEGITEATVKVYENLRGDKMTSTQEELMIRGSSAEDDGTRPLQHFYDPVNDRGLKVLLQWLSSKLWAQDTEFQGNYCDYGWCPKRIGYMDKPFSSPTDYSWDRAVYEYAHGDKDRALTALGHILHLIQDATVPAHTRNDQHLNHQGFGDPDPYEDYTSQFVRGNIALPKGITVPVFENIADALDETARFTNSNFLSKDTVFDKYASPNLASVIVSDKFAVNPVLGNKLARSESVFDKRTGRFEKRWFLNDDGSEISSDYWEALSKEAIQNSIGVIDLFFREVEKEKQTFALKERNKSAAELKAIADARKGFKYVKMLYGSSLSQDDVDELLGVSNQAGAAAAAFGNSESESQTPVVTLAGAIETITSAPVQPSQQQPIPVQQNAPIEVIEGPASLPAPLPPAPESPAPSAAPPQPSSPFSSIFSFPQGGGGGGGSSAVVEVSAPPVSLAVTSPTSGSSQFSTNVNIQGTTEAGATVRLSEPETEVTADSNGVWAMDIVLAEGIYTLEFQATDSAGDDSEIVEVELSIDMTAPDAPIIAVDDCDFSISFTDCTLPTDTTTVSWDAVVNAASYGVEINGTLATTTTELSAQISITEDTINSIRVYSYDAAGNSAISSPVQVYSELQPIIINELAWAGTTATSAADWIELKNRSSIEVDLSRFSVATVLGGANRTLAGVIGPANNFDDSDLVLIERAAPSISAQHTFLAALLDLSSSGDQIQLLWGNGVSETVVDATPWVDVCSGWCAGGVKTIGDSLVQGASLAPVSMERIALDGQAASSWQSSDTYFYSGNVFTDSGGNIVYGTPGKDNSLGKPSFGWFCGSDTNSISEGASYTPVGPCTFLSRFIHDNANRYGAVYRGVLGNAVSVGTHFLSKSIEKIENLTLPNDLVAGESFFIAVWELRFDADFDNFRDYFTTGSTTSGSTEPPHTNFKILEWTYQP